MRIRFASPASRRVQGNRSFEREALEFEHDAVALVRQILIQMESLPSVLVVVMSDGASHAQKGSFLVHAAAFKAATVFHHKFPRSPHHYATTYHLPAELLRALEALPEGFSFAQFSRHKELGAT